MRVSKYKQEDGHFELKDKADSEFVTAIESGEVKTAPDEKDSDSSKTPVTLYENFYCNETEDYDADGKKDGTIRVYTKTGISTLHVSSRVLFHKMRMKSLWTECMQTTWV